MPLKHTNILKAEAINRFLYYLNNPEACEVGDVLHLSNRAQLCKCIMNDMLANEMLSEALKEVGAAFTLQFIENAINENRRTVPYLEEDVEQATACDRDIVNFAACSDSVMHPADAGEVSKEGYRII